MFWYKNIILPDGINVPVVNMSGSPVIDVLSNTLVVNRQDTKAVYMQLAEQITTLLRGEILKAGTALPGTRQLSVALQLHRKTIVATYEELALQGIVIMIPNKGTFINHDIVFSSLQSSIDEKNGFPQKAKFQIPHNRILEIESRKQISDYVLDDGNPDGRLFEGEKLGIGFSGVFGKNYTNTSSFLQHILSRYISETNHISVPENQILITSNKAMNIALITLALLKKDDVVIVADPGNYIINMAIQQTGAVLKTIPMESDGFDVGALEEICKKQTIRMVFVEPQNHYPTTTILSYAKRLELLRLASQYGFFILEEETDSLINFQKNKLPSLAALDSEGVVVYSHSFEQVMRPDWNIGYIVAPKNVLDEIRKYLVYIGAGHIGLAQHIVASALQSGGLQRIIKKNTKSYLERRNQLCQLLHRDWSQYTHFEVPKAGLGLWLNFEWGFNLSSFAKKYGNEGIIIPNSLLYQSRKWIAMRLGFGKWNEEEMAVFVEKGKAYFI